jgi:hypothetical protein
MDIVVHTGRTAGAGDLVTVVNGSVTRSSVDGDAARSVDRCRACRSIDGRCSYDMTTEADQARRGTGCACSLRRHGQPRTPRPGTKVRCAIGTHICPDARPTRAARAKLPCPGGSCSSALCRSLRADPAPWSAGAWSALCVRLSGFAGALRLWRGHHEGSCHLRSSVRA